MTAGLRRAKKLAGLVVDARLRRGAFVPLHAGGVYGAYAVAECRAGRRHVPPFEDCACGFYAGRSLTQTLQLVQPTLERLARLALLDVELGGLELAGPRGLRAEQQRVLGAHPLPWCALCVAADPEGRTASTQRGVRLYAVGQDAVRDVVPLCETHAELAMADATLTLGDAAGLLGTAVTWAPGDVRRRILRYFDRHLIEQGRHDLVVAHRPLTQLRMGQLGFVEPDAVRPRRRRPAVAACRRPDAAAARRRRRRPRAPAPRPGRRDRSHCRRRPSAGCTARRRAPATPRGPRGSDHGRERAAARARPAPRAVVKQQSGTGRGDMR